MKKFLTIVALLIIGYLVVVYSYTAIETKINLKRLQPLIDAKIATIEKSLDQTNFKVTVYASLDGGENYYLYLVGYRDGEKVKFWRKNDYNFIKEDIASEDELIDADFTYRYCSAFNVFPDYVRHIFQKSKWERFEKYEIEKFEKLGYNTIKEGNVYRKILDDDIYTEVIEDGYVYEQYRESYSYPLTGKLIPDDKKLLCHLIYSELGEIKFSDEIEFPKSW